MKKMIFLFIIIIPLHIAMGQIKYLSNSSLTYSEIRERDNVERTFYIDDEKIAKIISVWDENNQRELIRREGDIKDGVYINREDNKSFIVFKNNKLDGKSVLYYPTGELRDERIFKEGKFVGERKRYYKDGKLERYVVCSGDKYVQEYYREDRTLGMRVHITLIDSILSDNERFTTYKTVKIEKFDKEGKLIKE